MPYTPKHRAVLIALASALTLSCAAAPGTKDLITDPDVLEDLEHAKKEFCGPSKRVCLGLYTTKLTKGERAIVLESFDQALSVIESETYYNEILRHDDWLASVDQIDGETGAYRAIKGSDLYEILYGNTSRYSDIQVLVNPLAKKDRAGLAVLVESEGELLKAITIDSDMITRWRDGTPLARSLLIGIIVHELTHVIVSRADDENPIRFDDNGHTAETRKLLVSYKVGYIASCAYAHQENAEDTTTCVEHLLENPP